MQCNRNAGEYGCDGRVRESNGAGKGNSASLTLSPLGEHFADSLGAQSIPDKQRIVSIGTNCRNLRSQLSIGRVCGVLCLNGQHR